MDLPQWEIDKASMDESFVTFDANFLLNFKEKSITLFGASVYVSFLVLVVLLFPCLPQREILIAFFRTAQI